MCGYALQQAWLRRAWLQRARVGLEGDREWGDAIKHPKNGSGEINWVSFMNDSPVAVFGEVQRWLAEHDGAVFIVDVA